MNRAVLSIVALAVGCDAGAATLVVDMKTDWVGGVEVATADVQIEGTDHTAQRPLRLEDDLAGGFRVAELDGVPFGTHEVRLTLRAPNGAEVATRRALVSLDGPRAVTLLLTRNCAGVTCDAPGRTECIDATCVPPGCVEEDPAACEESTCETNADCGGGAVAACVEPTCSGGFCLGAPVFESCAGGEYCDPEAGCQSLPIADAGVPDAGPADAGATDAGSIDAGTTDAGSTPCVDALEPNETPDPAADAPVAVDFGPSSVHTEPGLSLCGADVDWIAVGTLGVVQVRADIDTTLVGAPGQVCGEIYTWSETSRAVMMAPTMDGTSSCATAGGPLTLGPTVATLDSGGNYILVRLTSDTDVDYDVTFTGSL